VSPSSSPTRPKAFKYIGSEDDPLILQKKKKSIRDIGAELPQSYTGAISAPAPQPLIAAGFCTSENYDFKRLIPNLKLKYALMPYLADGISHFKLQPPTQAEENLDLEATSDAADAFIFDDGTFVTWGASKSENEDFIKAIKPFQINPYGSVETELFDYFVDSSQEGGIVADTIILGEELPLNQAKLAFSSGIARSVKLACLESLLEMHLNKNRKIPTLLLKGKKLPFGEDEVLRNLGELFALRGSVNLHSELLDSPEFVWSNALMESYFEKINKNLDVKPRIAIFNKKLDYANELAEVLRNHLNEKHALKLEWFIIILICVEIAFEVLHYAEKLKIIEIVD
jgi:uncharacterized Rmd1/YagE family protein